MNERTSLSKQALVLIVGRILSFSFTFFVPIVLVRLYAKEQFGLFQQLLLIFNTFYPILQLGITNSLLYFYPRDIDKRKALLSQTFYFIFLVGILFTLVLIIFQNEIALYFHNPEIKQLVPLLGLYILLMLVSSILEILLIVEEKAFRASLVIFFSGFFRFVFLVGASLILREVFVLLVALLLISLIRVTILVYYLLKHYTLSFFEFDLKYFYIQLQYSLPFGLASVFVILNTTIDKYIISYFFDSRLYAIYAIGCFQIPVVSLIFDPIVSIILPKISKLQKESDIHKVHNIWRQAASKLSLIGFPFFVLFFVMANDIIVLLFTENYKNSVPIFMIFLLLLPRQMTNYGVIVRAYGHTKYILRVCFFSLFVAIVLMYPALKFLSIVGPPIVVVFSLYLTAYFQLLKTRKLLKVSWSNLLHWDDIFKNFSIATIVGFVVFISKSSLSFTPLLNVVAYSLLFFSIYIALANRYQLIGESDKKLIIELLSRISIKRISS